MLVSQKCPLESCTRILFTAAYSTAFAFRYRDDESSMSVSSVLPVLDSAHRGPDSQVNRE